VDRAGARDDTATIERSNSRRDGEHSDSRLRAGRRALRAFDAYVRAARQRPPPTSLDERLFAQAGKFSRRADAVELVDELKAQGLVNAFVVTEDGRRKSVHRVRVGPLPDDAQVKRMNDRLRDLGAKRSRSVVMP